MHRIKMTRQEVLDKTGAKYLAMDDYGDIWVYDYKPEIGTTKFLRGSGDHSWCLSCVEITDFKGDWKDSLYPKEPELIPVDESDVGKIALAGNTKEDLVEAKLLHIIDSPIACKKNIVLEKGYCAVTYFAYAFKCGQEPKKESLKPTQILADENDLNQSVFVPNIGVQALQRLIYIKDKPQKQFVVIDTKGVIRSYNKVFKC